MSVATIRALANKTADTNEREEADESAARIKHRTGLFTHHFKALVESAMDAPEDIAAAYLLSIFGISLYLAVEKVLDR